MAEWLWQSQTLNENHNKWLMPAVSAISWYHLVFFPLAFQQICARIVFQMTSGQAAKGYIGVTFVSNVPLFQSFSRLALEKHKVYNLSKDDVCNAPTVLYEMPPELIWGNSKSTAMDLSTWKQQSKSCYLLSQRPIHANLTSETL